MTNDLYDERKEDARAPNTPIRNTARLEHCGSDTESKVRLIPGEVILYQSSLHGLRVTNRRVLNESEGLNRLMLQSVALNQVGMCEFEKVSRPWWLVLTVVFCVPVLVVISMPAEPDRIGWVAAIVGTLLAGALVSIAKYFRSRRTALKLFAGGAIINIPVRPGDGQTEFLCIVRAIHGAKADRAAESGGAI